MGTILFCSKPKCTARNLMKCSEASSKQRTSSKPEIGPVSVAPTDLDGSEVEPCKNGAKCSEVLGATLS